MRRRFPLHHVGIGVALVALAGCAAPIAQVTLPTPRALGRAPTVVPRPGDAEAPPDGEPRGVLVLRQALALALVRSPELASASLDVRAAEARVLQAGLLPNPEAELEIEEFGGKGERRGFQGAETTLALGQLVELGHKRRRRVRVAALEGELAGWDYEATRLDVLTATAKGFVDVLAAQRQVALRRELVKLSEQVLRNVAERVEAGRVPPLEGLKAKLAVAISRVDLEKAARALEAARKSLAARWQSTSPAFERVGGELAVAARIPPAERLAERLAESPELARWPAELRQRQAQVALAKAEGVSDVTVGGGVAYFKETDDAAFLLSLSFDLPVFDRNQGGIREAEIEAAKAEQERRAALATAHAALAEAHRELATAAAESHALQTEILPTAQAAFDAAMEGFRQGKSDYLDVLDAQRALFEARQEQIEALAAYHRAVADVERLVGRPLASIPTE